MQWFRNLWNRNGHFVLESGIGVVFPSTQYFCFFSRPIFRCLLRVSPNNLDVLLGASSARRSAGLTAHSPLQSATLLSQHYHYLRLAESACSPFCYVFHYFLFIKFISLFSHVCVTGQLL